MPKKVTPKKEKTLLRFGMRVRVTDKDSFYFGLTGSLSAADHHSPTVLIELDVENDEEEVADHWVHIDTVTPLDKADPEFDGVYVEEDEDEDEEEDPDDLEPEESPMLPPLVALAKL